MPWDPGGSCETSTTTATPCAVWVNTAVPTVFPPGSLRAASAEAAPLFSARAKFPIRSRKPAQTIVRFITSLPPFRPQRTLTTQRDIPLLHFTSEEEQQSFGTFSNRSSLGPP